MQFILYEFSDALAYVTISPLVLDKEEKNKRHQYKLCVMTQKQWEQSCPWD